MESYQEPELDSDCVSSVLVAFLFREKRHAVDHRAPSHPQILVPNGCLIETSPLVIFGTGFLQVHKVTSDWSPPWVDWRLPLENQGALPDFTELQAVWWSWGREREQQRSVCTRRLTMRTLTPTPRVSRLTLVLVFSTAISPSPESRHVVATASFHSCSATTHGTGGQGHAQMPSGAGPSIPQAVLGWTSHRWFQSLLGQLADSPQKSSKLIVLWRKDTVMYAVCTWLHF